MSIGGTLMYETATKTRTAPNVTDLAKSLVVYEGDVQFKNIKLAPGLNSNWSFEGAQSHTNPNLNDFAIVDNMVERLWHKYLPQEEYISYQAGTTLTLQF